MLIAKDDDRCTAIMDYPACKRARHGGAEQLQAVESLQSPLLFLRLHMIVDALPVHSLPQQLYVMGSWLSVLEVFAAFFGGIRTQGSIALHAPREAAGLERMPQRGMQLRIFIDIQDFQKALIFLPVLF